VTGFRQPKYTQKPVKQKYPLKIQALKTKKKRPTRNTKLQTAIYDLRLKVQTKRVEESQRKTMHKDDRHGNF
jgi:hypothetical protein